MVNFGQCVCAFVAAFLFPIPALLTGIGPCPKLELMEGFNQSLFTGSWYEVERSFYLMEIVSRCVKIELIENRRKHLQVLITSRSRWSKIFCHFKEIDLNFNSLCPPWFNTLQEYYISRTRSGDFILSEGIAIALRKHPSLYHYKVDSDLPRAVSKYLPGSGYYQVVDTDYDNFAIVYSCTNVEIFHTDLVWIWTRQGDINATVRAKIYEILLEKHLDSDRLVIPNNGNCDL